MTEHERTGPLTGIRVVEIGSIGPGPFCAMLLADLGADVVRVDRSSGGGLVGPNADHRTELLNRGRRSIALDLKHPDGAAVVLDLVERADVLVEGFRPGVAERLGIGPDACRARNPRLVYGRMTGYGQDGPLAQAVGHDINYIAQSGVLGMIGREGQPPTMPLSLAGDFGGGGMVLAMGILAALVERHASGLGQTIDASMVDGSATLATAFYGFAQTGAWSTERGTNLVDGGAPFYDTYETADGRWLALGPLEPAFYAAALRVLGLDGEDLPAQDDRSGWPVLRERFAATIRTRTRDAWVEAADGVECCISAVLGVDEVADDPHLRARGTFAEHHGLVQPTPSPRFDRTPARLGLRPPLPGEHTEEALGDWGLPADRVADLAARGVAGRAGAASGGGAGPAAGATTGGAR
ncbi:CaiB/BaiF CoA transferase family protein [Patulibacter minatonensis]|uniref:CaiB/BaiF CoA transferase family protein n=1 Tax=Patulibacter minatonensis TaxID=298163 RepID=UPI0004BA804B|nr:CaiB/BaiF CoA-transferase family protein [Patulibacter minatonensis]